MTLTERGQVNNREPAYGSDGSACHKLMAQQASGLQHVPFVIAESRVKCHLTIVSTG